MALEKDLNELVQAYEEEHKPEKLAAVIRTSYGPYMVCEYRVVNGVPFIDQVTNPVIAIVSEENMAITVAQTYMRSS